MEGMSSSPSVILSAHGLEAHAIDVKVMAVVTPAKAGVHKEMDSRFRGNDEPRSDFRGGEAEDDSGATDD
jgi:hypothetical protein